MNIHASVITMFKLEIYDWSLLCLDNILGGIVCESGNILVLFLMRYIWVLSELKKTHCSQVMSAVSPVIACHTNVLIIVFILGTFIKIVGIRKCVCHTI